MPESPPWPLLAIQRDGYVPQLLVFLEWNDWGAPSAGPSRYEAPEGGTRFDSGTLVASNLLVEAQHHSIDLLRVVPTEAANRAIATGLTVERLDSSSCFVKAFGISRHADLNPELFFGDRLSNSVRFMRLKL